MNPLIETLNHCGENVLHFAWPMLWQSSVLIAVLFVFDFALRRHVRAAVRYALWLVLLVKLLLPPSLALPTGAVWWLFPSVTPPAKKQTTEFAVNYGPETISSLPPQPTPVFVPPPQPSMSAAAWAIPAWGAFSLGLFAWLTVRWRQVTRVVRCATPPPDWLGEVFDEAKSSTGLRLTVRLRLTDQSMSPAACGLFRPVILLPQSLAQKLPPVQLRTVLLHELTHLRRGDVWMNCAQALAQIVYWWHPLLWFANARIRRVREEAVDDAVMLALRDEAETYAPTLLEVAKLAFHRPLASLGLVGILESRSALRQRIERLVNFHAPRKAGLTFISLCGIFIFSAAALPMGEAPSHSTDSNDVAHLQKADGKMAKTPPGKTDSETADTTTMTFKIDHPPDANRLKKLLFDAGVKIPPTVYFYTDNGLLLVRGDEEQLSLVNSAVLKLNGYLPKEISDKTNVDAKVYSSSFSASSNLNLVQTAKAGPQMGIVAVTPAGQKDIMDKLNRIRFDQVSWPDGLPLSEVLRNLSDQTRLRDPDKKGIHFIFHTNAPAASAATASAGGEAVDASSINVKLTLTNIRLADLLDAIVLVADHPIQYSILDDGIIFSTKVSNSAPMETRTFKVDNNVFLANLRKQTALQTNVAAAMRQLLSNIGVDLSPPKSIFFSDRLGVLFVHATEQDLDFVEKVVMVLTYTPPPQIHIKARFVEVPEETVKNLAANLVPTGLTNVTGILTGPNFQRLLHTLEQGKEFQALGEPEFTTTSGRQTQMRVTDILTIITNFVFQETSTNSFIAPQQSQVEIGPVLDVVPSVLPDGNTIELKTTASLTQWLGYTKPPTNSTPVVTSTGKIVDVPIIHPSFHVQQASTQVKLWDGQTVILGRFPSFYPTNVPMSGISTESFRTNYSCDHQAENKELLVFVTVTLVDPAGNRIHSDDEIARKQHSAAGFP